MKIELHLMAFFRETKIIFINIYKILFELLKAKKQSSILLANCGFGHFYTNFCTTFMHLV
jgi:hypothetical protein